MSELFAQELDAAVAEVLGIADEADTFPYVPGALLCVPAEGKSYFFRPSTSWNDGGPLIERFGMDVRPEGANSWVAFVGSASGAGPTPLIAAMRALVASATK